MMAGTCSVSPATEMALSMRTLMVWGLLAGLLAGVLALGFASAFGEPSVEVAIAFESASAEKPVHDHGTQPAAEPVSRGVQRTIGLAIATCLFGTALGGLFALAFAFGYGRIGRLTPRNTALLLAAVGFAAVFLVPFLNYPANPPSVGNPDTIGNRSAVYFGMILISIVLAIAAIYARRRLAERIEGWHATVLAMIGYIVAAWATGALLPHFHEVPDGFPAQSLWEFRIASFGTQVVLWATIGIAFAFLAERAEQRATKRATDAGLLAG
jgi:predicted cobalt transporter CbtA